MNMSFYNAAVGAQQQQNRLNVQANNISNVNTFGFKAKKVSFQQLMYRNLQGNNDEQISRGSGAQMVKATTDFISGTYQPTGNHLDFAINGSGFFALYHPISGEITYTRDGSFTLSQFMVPAPVEENEEQADADAQTEEDAEPEMIPEWRLTDGAGRCVLDSRGNFIRLADPNESTIQMDIGIFDYTIYDGMQNTDSGRFLPTDKNGNLYWGTGELRRGFLEISNVDLGLEMTKVIESQRAYSYALKMVQTSDEIETTINGLRG